jgi:methylated-DNA-protein-cysteine methyltransferase related protein
VAARFPGPRAAPVPSEEARRRVLQVVRRIPPGCVASYGQVAFEAGLPGRARLVGRILSDSSDARLPWHRVMNAQGRISLPKSSPAHAEQKRRLRDEGVVFLAGAVSMKRFGWRPRSEAPLLD